LGAEGIRNAPPLPRGRLGASPNLKASRVALKRRRTGVKQYGKKKKKTNFSHLDLFVLLLKHEIAYFYEGTRKKRRRRVWPFLKREIEGL